jgi:hypothetical protein
MCWLHVTPKKIPWYTFLIEAEYTPQLLIADRRSHLKISNNPTRNLTWNFPSCGITTKLHHQRAPHQLKVKKLLCAMFIIRTVYFQYKFFMFSVQLFMKLLFMHNLMAKIAI